MDRRTFLKLAGMLTFYPHSSALAKGSASRGILVNDMHCQLNPTRVSKVVHARSTIDLQSVILQAAKDEQVLSICGGRHAGGGQQFGTNSILIDMTSMNRIIQFDRTRGLLEVESGVRWPKLLSYLEIAQTGSASPWGISQKQTGAEELTIGGALSANAHGQGLTLKPFISDVESFKLIDYRGQQHICSRQQNSELFHAAIGGYGMLGIIHSVTLRLVPRRKVQRLVEIMDIEQLIPKVEQCINAGFPYGSFQINIDEQSDSYLRKGIFSGYQLVDATTPITDASLTLSPAAWLDFVYGAHVNKSATFEKYASYYQSTSGHVNWSDVWQSGPYVEHYHAIIDHKLHAPHKATEVLTELYVPRRSLCDFLEDVRANFLKNNVNVIYSTIRFIEQDNESYLPWAKQAYACVIFNLHTVHTDQGIEMSANACKRLIDYAIKYDGSYYLTYHKYATKQQVLACYPQLPQLLQLKHKYDPAEIYQSDWYRHHLKLLI